MQTSLRTTCSLCGDVDVPFAAARMLVSMDLWDPRNTIEFDCPTCHRQEQHPIDERGTRLLLAAGIVVAAGAPAPQSFPEASGNDHSR